jgi:uncharacterized protein
VDRARGRRGSGRVADAAGADAGTGAGGPARRPAGLRDDPLFHHLHATLPPAGYAVFTFDRRGEGASTGEPSAGRFELLAADANAVAGALAAHDDVDARRIGLWGISQGGWVAPLAAVRSGRAAFLVLLSS